MKRFEGPTTMNGGLKKKTECEPVYPSYLKTKLVPWDPIREKFLSIKELGPSDSHTFMEASTYCTVSSHKDS